MGWASIGTICPSRIAVEHSRTGRGGRGRRIGTKCPISAGSVLSGAGWIARDSHPSLLIPLNAGRAVSGFIVLARLRAWPSVGASGIAIGIACWDKMSDPIQDCRTRDEVIDPDLPLPLYEVWAELGQCESKRRGRRLS
jgi:hypothetical protein